jgi:hypothetical protein
LRTGILSQVMRRVPISLLGPPKGFQVLGHANGWLVYNLKIPEKIANGVHP